MIHYKNQEEILKMREGGKILADTLNFVLKHVKEGVSELELDSIAEDFIRNRGAEPGFKKVKGYKHTLCMSTNDIVVHGVPSEYRFKNGDIVGVDCGVFYEGFNTDMSESIIIGEIRDFKKNNFLNTGKNALLLAIESAIPGNRIGHISEAIQTAVERQGYSVVRSLIGHGVGKTLHEEPEVPGFLEGRLDDTPLLKEGLTIAIEVIYNMGKPDVVYGRGDGWTIRTEDGSLSGLFERTVLITAEGNEVLTK